MRTTTRMKALVLLGLLVLLGAAPPALADDAKDFLPGKDLAGWNGLKEYWKVEDGAIVGSTFPDGIKFNTFLCSKKKYKDFELKFQVRLKDGKGNSGIQIRSEVFDEKRFAVQGPQCDIGDKYWGSLYGENFSPDGKQKAGMMKAAPSDKVMKELKKDDFNDYYILVKGKKVTIKVNGVTCVDEEFERLPNEGIIAFQVHGGGAMEVTFKKIEFKDLSAK